MAKISGVWKWKSQITCTWMDFTEYSAHFICNGKTYSGIGCQWSVGYHWLYYVDSTGSMLKVGANTVEGVDRFPIDSKYNVINFGDGQEIDGDLYNFILANASPMKLIRGKWKWKEVILCNLDSDSPYSATFESNWDQFTGIWCTQRQTMHVLQYVHVDGYVITIGETYESANNYLPIDEKYRIMDFGKEQAIDPDLYDLIVSNAMCLEISPNISKKLLRIANGDREIAEMNRQLEQTLYGVDHGGKSYYDEFWDAFQPNKGNASNYQYTFCNMAWNDETFKPKYDIVFGLGYTGTYAFWGSDMTNIAETLEKLGRKIDTTLCGYMASMFQGAKTKRIPELNCSHAMDYNTGGLHMTFLNCDVETIDKLIVTEGLKYASAFVNCKNLKNIVFEGVIGNDIDLHWSTALTRASMENIISHLSDTASGKTLTLSEPAVFEAFRYEGNLSYLTNPDWEALVESKSNWTITLV